MKSALQLPFFIPTFVGKAEDVFRGTDFVVVTNSGVLRGTRAVIEERSTCLQSGGEGVSGEIAWLDSAKYDEAVEELVSRTGGERCSRAFVSDQGGKGEVDCWVYLEY
jgi:hypothetical protein